MSKYPHPIFRHYLEGEDDKPYYTMNSLAFYYEDMERKQKLIESLAKSIAGYDIRLTENLEAIEQEVDKRLADWDKQLETFPASVEDLLTKWTTDGTIDQVIQTALIDEKIQPLTAQLADKVNKGEVSVSDINKNLGLIDETFLSDTLKAQMTGTTAIGSTPPDESITLMKTTIYKLGSNRFNKNEAVDGAYIRNTDGAQVDNASFASSGFIPVSPLTEYIIKNARYYAFYNSDKVFISGETGFTPFAGKVVTTPANAKYLRFSWSKADISVDSQQVNEGNLLYPYEPFEIYINKAFVEKPDLVPADIPSTPIEKLEFSKKKNNLFNKDTLIQDKYINTTSGNEVSSAGWVATDFIEVEPSTAYTLKYMRQYAFYTEAKTTISAHSQSGSSYTVTTPSNAKFIRFSWYPVNDSHIVTPDTQQLNKGTELLPYESYGYVIPITYLELTGGQDAVPERGVLPSKIFGVVGKELNIYFENILNVPSKDVQIDVTCSIGKHEKRRWAVTPTSAGTFPLTISIYKNYKLLREEKTDVIVKAASVGTGATRTALIIGDSTINQNWMIMRTQTLISTDPLAVNFEGTRGAYGAKHEGRGGWSAARYRTNDAYEGVVNPFYNPTIEDFDFQYYMSDKTHPTPNYVGFCSGINDVFSRGSDSSLMDALPTTFADFDHIINNIKSYDSAIKVGLFVTIPPNENQDAFGEAYANGQNQWRYKRNNALWIEQLVKRYGNREAEGIFLIPDNNNIDAQNGFRDAVHPNEEIGDKQRGDTLYYWLKSFES